MGTTAFSQMSTFTCEVADCCIIIIELKIQVLPLINSVARCSPREIFDGCLDLRDSSWAVSHSHGLNHVLKKQLLGMNTQEI